MTYSGWDIKLYSISSRQEWDDFISGSRNGTFLFLRGYMDYHADRFKDSSLMAYHGGKLHAVLPAHVAGETLYSHCGLTYGGIVSDEKMTAALMMELFGALVHFMHSSLHVAKWIYRPVPYIYARYPSEEDLYALFRFGGRLVERRISTVVPSVMPYGFSTLRRRKTRHALRAGFTLRKESDFEAFWTILESNLGERHHAHPVHSLAEIQLLHDRFPENIVLHTVYDREDCMVAGCVMYLSACVAHVQYIGSTAKGRDNGAVDLLFDHLIHKVYSGFKYFDMGTSVEDGGQLLNKGLVFQKEGFGGRAVVYDTYELDVVPDACFRTADSSNFM